MEAMVYFDMAEKLGNTDALKYSGVIYLESGNPQKAIPRLKSYLDHLDSQHEDRKVVLNDLGVAKVSQNRGYMAISEIGNQLIINCVHQHPDRPFVMGGMFHGGAGNNMKSLSSKSGNIICQNYGAYLISIFKAIRIMV